MSNKIKYEGYIIDLDGTIYRGNEAIDGASRFIKKLFNRKIPYVFLTNNASLFPEEIKNLLHSMDIPVETEQIVTSAIAASHYIKEYFKDDNIYIVGEQALIHACKNENLNIVSKNKQADIVLMGMNRHLTYENLVEASLQIQNGAKLIATNTDLKIPKERGFYPGNGSLIKVITSTTTVEPFVIGKPNEPIMTTAIRRLQLPREKIAMIGDNYTTDILAGFNQTIDTIMVLTGVSTKRDVLNKKRQPTYIVEDLNEWLSYL